MAKKRARSLARLLFGRVPDDQLQLAYRVRVGIFFLLVVIIVAAVHVNDFSNTLLYCLNASILGRLR